ncbi:MAG: hypothetical protein D6808_04105 [Candidatus Dadabacteria bacterium]|nr:MAG: hypothetical protein D6808_04105 [Candidatus Dadabacteria bacterium]
MGVSFNYSSNAGSALFRQKPREAGFAAVMVSAMIILMVAAISAGLNGVVYYNEKSLLQKNAQNIAQYGASFLPNPKNAHDGACRLWEILKQETRFKDSRLPAGKQTGIGIYFSSAAGDKIPYVASYGRSSLPTKCSPYLDQEEPIDGVRLALPVKSITVRLEKEFKLFFVPFIPKLSLVAEATAYLAPTDVVLVIEDTNSIVSHLLEERGNLPSAFDFKEWRSCSGVSEASCTKESCSSKAISCLKGESCSAICPIIGIRKLRQCFGKVAQDIKKAALYTYDLLSSSGTFRVGVVFSTVQQGEWGWVLVPLRRHPYLRSYLGIDKERLYNSTNINYLEEFSASSRAGMVRNAGLDPDPNADVVLMPQGANASLVSHTSDLNRAESLPERTETECAAATDKYPVPSHPFLSLFSADYASGFKGDLTIDSDGAPLMAEKGRGSLGKEFFFSQFRYLSNGDPYYGRFYGRSDKAVEGGQGFSGARPSKSFRLLPREGLWIQSMGKSDKKGELLPSHDYSSLKMGILKGMSLLQSALPREDGLPVRRKVILVFSDGYEYDGKLKLFAGEGPITNIGGGTRIGVERQDLSSLGYMSLEKITSQEVSDTVPMSQLNYIERKEASEGTCKFSASSLGLLPVFNISGSSSPSDYSFPPFKVGILRYQFRDIYVKDVTGRYDPSLPYFSFHDSSGSSTNSQRGSRDMLQCNTAWGFEGGRFLVSPSSDVATTGASDLYWQSIPPHVARSLFAVEIGR